MFIINFLLQLIYFFFTIVVIVIIIVIYICINEKVKS